MRVSIQPFQASGNVLAPPSKSMAHRLLIAAGLSGGESRLTGIAPSEDVLATIDCLRALGARVTLQGDTVTVAGCDPQARTSPVFCPCRECGSTLRFFLPICLLGQAEAVLTGSDRLLQRPMSVYEDLCADRGLRYAVEKDGIHVQGPLTSGIYTIPGDISSQFISGLLFVLPLLSGDSTLFLTGHVESRSYIEMTITALSAFGVHVGWVDDMTIYIPGSQSYEACEMAVEGDYSNAAFFAALNALGGSVVIQGLHENSGQGDRVYADLFPKLMRANVNISLADCPDLGPILMTVAAACHGAHFTDTARLKIKESDRGETMAAELRKFGAQVMVQANDIYVEKVALHAPDTCLNGHNDHRIVMSLAVLSSVYGGEIVGAQAVNKSFPDFFERLQNIGAKLSIYDD